MTAMTAATLDLLSGGRFRLGLGVSGPQVSEGWHGVRFAEPLARTRAYVEVVRLALARETVRHDGPHHPLPLPDGPGKALRLGLRPAARARAALPRRRRAEEPRAGRRDRRRLAGRLLRPGARRTSSSSTSAPAGPGSGSTSTGFDVVPTVPLSVGADPQASAPTRCGRTPPSTSAAWAAASRTSTSRSPSGWGSREAAAEIQDLYLAGRPRDAEAAVPYALVDRTSLLGDRARVADGLARLAAAGRDDLRAGPVRGDLAGAARRADPRRRGARHWCRDDPQRAPLRRRRGRPQTRCGGSAGRMVSPVSVWTALGEGRRAGWTVSSFLVADGEPGEVVGVVDEDSDLGELLTAARGPSRRVRRQPARPGSSASWPTRSPGQAPAPGRGVPAGGVDGVGRGARSSLGSAGWIGARLTAGRPATPAGACSCAATVEHVELPTAGGDGLLTHVRGRYRPVRVDGPTGDPDRPRRRLTGRTRGAGTGQP